MQAIPRTGYSRLAVHRMMLADRPRTEAFRRAIEAVVRPEHVVVDVGSGSGVLAFFAAMAGARKVYAIEREEIVQLAKRVAMANHLDGRIEFIEADVESLGTLPERADVLVSECVGSALVNTTLMDRMLAARERFLKPGAAVIPRLGQLVACPVEVPVHDWYLRFWERPQYGLDWRELSLPAANQLYTAIVATGDLLAEPQQVAELDFTSPLTRTADLAGDTRYRLTRDGVVHGIAVWFRLQLSPELWLSTGPADEQTCWYQTLLPLQEAISGVAGGELSVHLEARHIGQRVAWRWSVEGSGVVSRTQDSELSFPALLGEVNEPPP